MVVTFYTQSKKDLKAVYVRVRDGVSVDAKANTGLVVIGAGIGIGRIGGSAMEAIARQPEATGKIQTAMLIAAALIEGIGFAALFAV